MRRRRFSLGFARGLLLLLLIGVALPLAAEDEIPPGYRPLAGLLMGNGVKKEHAGRFIRALDKAETDGEFRTLRTFLASENEFLCVMAGFILAVEEPKETRKRVRALLDEGTGPSRSLLLVLSFVPRKTTVDEFLKRWEKSHDQKERGMIALLLRAMTKQNPGGLDEWKTWWAANRKTVRLKRVKTVDEAMERMRFAGNAAIADAFGGLARRNEAKNNADEALDDILGSIDELNELGMEPESRAAERGDRLFARGKLNQAEKVYRTAIRENEGDLKSAFLLGCLEFERGDLEAARQRFDKLANRSENALAARFLVRLCDRRGARPQENMWDAVTELVLRTSDAGLEDLPCEDVVIRRLFGQQMVGRGIFSFGSERLSTLASEHPDDIEIQIGVALRAGPRGAESQIKGVLERFPDSPVVLSRFMAATSTSPSPEERRERLEICDRWAKLEPANLLPHVHRIALMHFRVSKNGEPDPGVLPDDVWEDLVRKCRTLKPDDHLREAFEAQVRVARMLGQPFPEATESVSSHYGMFAAIGELVKQRIKGQLESGKDVREPLMVMDTVAAEPALCTMLESTIRLGCRAGARRPIIDHLRAVGEKGKAAELEKKREKTRARQREIMHALAPIHAVATIPIPSLRNELCKRLRKNPASLWKALPKLEDSQ